MKNIFLLLLFVLSFIQCKTRGNLVLNETQSCAGSELPQELKNRNGGAGLLEKSWDKHGTLVLQTYFFAICEGTTISGNKFVHHHKITISYSEDIRGEPSKCRCPKLYTHHLKGLDRNKEYEIEVIELD
ncbi:MAG: hypothetical protein AAF518_09965 [Spirochaetota bacterium]